LFDGGRVEGEIMTIEYKIIISVDLARLGRRINGVETSINDALSKCGVSEKLRIRAKIPMRLKVTRKLNQKERGIMKALLVESFNERLHANALIESFRCQSGKSCCNSSL
jgi:hypothetical protein